MLLDIYLLEMLLIQQLMHSNYQWHFLKVQYNSTPIIIYSTN